MLLAIYVQPVGGSARLTSVEESIGELFALSKGGFDNLLLSVLPAAPLCGPLLDLESRNIG